MSADRGEHTSEVRARRTAEGSGATENERAQRVTTPADLIATGSSGLLPTEDLAGARETGAGAGWRIVELDTSTGQDKPYFLDVCRAAFDLPDWFGANWDALADSLSDVSARPGTLVLWHGAGALEPAVREMAAEIFAERADRAGGEIGPFLVLVGSGDNAGRTMNDL